MHRLVFCVIFELTSLTVRSGYGFPTGAPDDASVCATLLPAHGVDPQTTESPYDVEIDGVSNDGSYDATQNITVTISGRNETTFRGFILQARQYTNSDYLKIGDFTATSGVRLTCETNGGSTVTHTDNGEKISIEVTWISPSNAMGKVQFSWTIVQSHPIFWRFLPEPDLPTAQPPSNSSVVLINTTECGETKGCYLDNCNDPNSASCDYGVTWTSDGADGTAFELFASATFTENPYVALGLSFDEKMGDDSVTDCLYNPLTGAVDVQMSWNNYGSNDPLSNKYLSLVNGSLSGYYANGMLVCRFTRLSHPPSNGTKTQGKAEDQIYYPGSDLYHLMIAKGPVISGFKQKHSFTPTVSAVKFNLTEFDVSSEQTGLSPLIKAHGIIMIFGWMVFASFGILMPRYFKTAWPGKTWCGKAIWFQIHRPLMYLTFLLTSAAFILIFVEKKDYSELDGPAAAHPPLGIVVMALVLINPVMAYFRPTPDAKRRWIFNILHFGVGLAAHLSATVALFLAMYIKSLEMPDWCVGVMIFYICWHACIEIILAIHMHKTQHKLKRKKHKKAEVTLNEMHQDNDSAIQAYEEIDEKSRLESYSLFRTALADLHLVGVLGCAIALSVHVGLM